MSSRRVRWHLGAMPPKATRKSPSGQERGQQLGCVPRSENPHGPPGSGAGRANIWNPDPFAKIGTTQHRAGASPALPFATPYLVPVLRRHGATADLHFANGLPAGSVAGHVSMGPVLLRRRSRVGRGCPTACNILGTVSLSLILVRGPGGRRTCTVEWHHNSRGRIRRDTGGRRVHRGRMSVSTRLKQCRWRALRNGGGVARQGPWAKARTAGGP